MDRHLPALPRVLMVPIALVYQLSHGHPPVEEDPHLAVLREDQVSRVKGGCAANVDAFLTVVRHVEGYAALSDKKIKEITNGQTI